MEYLIYVVQNIVIGVLMGCLYASIAFGLALIFGVMEIINFAHAEMMMIAMYISYFLGIILGVPPLLSIVVTFPVLFAVGVLVQKGLINPVLEAPIGSQVVITIGLVIILQNLALSLWKTDPRVLYTPYSGITVVLAGISVGLPRLIAAAISVIVMIGTFVFLYRTRMGLAMRATADNRDGAALCGVNVRRTYELAFGLGTSLLAFSAASLITFYPVFPMVGALFSITAWCVVCVAGLGSIFGVIPAGIILGLAESLGASLILGPYKQFITLIIFIVILLFRPLGLFGKKRW